MNEPLPIPDAELLTAWREGGDRGAFEALVRPWLAPIRRMVYFQVGSDPELFEEVQAEVLVALMTALRGFRGEAAFSTFLYTVVRRKAADVVRRRRRFRQRPADSLEDFEGALADERVKDPAWNLIQAEKEARLAAAVARLPGLDRSIVHLRLVEGLGEAETAQVLGLKPTSLRSRLDRIRKKLRARLREKEGEE